MTGDIWRFHNPVQVWFGPGALASLPSALGAGRPILVTTPGWVARGLPERITGMLGPASDPVVFGEVGSHPQIDQVEAAVREIRSRGGGDRIVAAGGGSAIDFGKALSVLLSTTSFSLRHHLEKGDGLPAEPPLPVHAVPTTAGTGSEVTPFATLWDEKTRRKHSLAGPKLFPRSAILDPELILSLPEGETVSSGLDALSQGLESIWSRNPNPVARSLARSAVKLSLECLPKVVQEPESVELRGRTLEASLLAGLAISATRTSLAHSISYPLTARFGVPHGLACSFTLPALCRFNMDVDDGRLAELACSLGIGDTKSLPAILLETLRGINAGRRLTEYMPSLEAVTALAPEMLQPGRADNNMRAATVEDVGRIVTEAWQEVVGGSQ